MEKVFSNELDIDGRTILRKAINKKQAPSIYVSDIGNWMSLRYWFEINRDYDDFKLSENKYFIFFSNTGLKNHKDEEYEDLYLVEVYSRGIETYVEDYYYVDSLKYDRWSIMKVMEKIQSLKEYDSKYDKIDYDKTYFLHDVQAFGHLAIQLINIINKIGPYQPFAMYELGY
jgi:hypothetical protein|tara:strand:- start:2016 stop:2531 length:516 start_codon:yes stop_codon:yes gene_type:complete